MRYLFRFILFVCLIVLITGCAKKVAQGPFYEGYSLQALLHELKGTCGIEASIEISYERGDSTLSGDLYLKANHREMLLRYYYLGLPAGEMLYRDGEIVSSNVRISKARTRLLAEGIKNSIFWWQVDYDEQYETDEVYILRAIGREINIDKKSLLPLNQTLRLSNGELVSISYSNPKKLHPEKDNQRPNDWYQSQVQIQYRDHSLDATIRRLSVSTCQGSIDN